MWNVDDIDSASVGSTSFLFHFYGVYFGSHRAGTCQSGQHLSTTCHHWECGNRRKRVPFSLSLSLYAFTEFSTEFRTRGPAVLTRAVGFLVDAVSHWFLPGSVMCYWTWYRFIFCGLIFNFFCGGGGGEEGLLFHLPSAPLWVGTVGKGWPLVSSFTFLPSFSTEFCARGSDQGHRKAQLIGLSTFHQTNPTAFQSMRHGSVFFFLGDPVAISKTKKFRVG